MAPITVDIAFRYPAEAAVFVTGGGSGTGAALAEEFRTQGTASPSCTAQTRPRAAPASIERSKGTGTTFVVEVDARGQAGHRIVP